MSEVKPIGIDADGYQVLTNAMLALLNSFPGLDGREILFEELGKEDGLAFSADAGALVMSERRSITDHVSQTCQYPLFVILRMNSTREYQKLQAQTFLDTLGKWLCKEPVEIGGTQYRLKSFPVLTDNRKITRISRSNSYGLDPDEASVQDWMLPVSVQYTNEFDMW